jgi:hypothetical protein
MHRLEHWHDRITVIAQPAEIARPGQPHQALLQVHARQAVAVGLGEQPSERRARGGLVGTGLLEASRLTCDRVGSSVDVHPEGPAGELLDVASGGGGHGSPITRNADIRIMTLSWEPPIGIEPMTYDYESHAPLH